MAKVGEIDMVDTALAGGHGDVVRQTEIIISNVLRGGVLISVFLILAGLGSFFVHQLLGHAVATTFPDTLDGVFTQVTTGQPLAIAMLGLLVLLATPVLRVAVSIIAFYIERDDTYVAITALVLAILLFSIFAVGYWLGQPGANLVQDATPSFFFAVMAASLVAGFIGALVGLGGGVFIVPILTLVFHLPFLTAIGASIVSVIATSSGAASAYVKDRMTNLRVGMFLEVATTLGAICGALLTTLLSAQVLFIVFGLVLIVSALPLLAKLGEELPRGVRTHRWARQLRLNGSYPDHRLHREVNYRVARVPAGFGMMYVAGLISGLLGIGSGVFKVLAMDTAMRLPMKVSTTTSNFMIGVTAAASAGIYFQRGAIDPVIAAPVALGVLAGAMIGALTLTRMSNAWLRKVFVPVILLVAANMLARGLGLL
ncbi:MAG TPA: TSUP family transporter [Acetobacteraceae bacterium]|nr:TSUP family transporter [Acetobacteraceae bacterium]